MTRSSPSSVLLSVAVQRVLWRCAAVCALGCASKDDLPVADLGGAPSVGDAPLSPQTLGVESQDPFWCLTQDPAPLPAPRPGSNVAFVAPVIDWSSRQPMAGRGLFTRLCVATDIGCTRPLAEPYTVLDGFIGNMPLLPGVAGVPVPEGFDGIVQFAVALPITATSEEQFFPLNYYLGAPISGNVSVGTAVLMTQVGAWLAMLQQAFPDVSPSLTAIRGTVVFDVRDCHGEPVSDARVQLLLPGRPMAGSLEGMVPFELGNTRIPIAKSPDEPLFTGSSGVGGFLAVPTGVVQLRAFRGDESKPFASVEVGSTAGQTSLGVLRPAYFLSADLSPSVGPAPPRL